MTKKAVKEFVASRFFRRSLTIVSILFIILTYFISVTPDSFLQFGYLGVFFFNTISSGLLIIPVLTQKLNLFLVVLVSALGNIPNTSISYLLGSTSSRFMSHILAISTAKEFMKRFGLFAVYVLAIIPLPLDVNGLMSGYLGISYKNYILVNFLGKITVFLLVGLGVIFVGNTYFK